MQRVMSFLEIVPPGTAPVWDTLDDTQRAEVEAVLARLMATLATVFLQGDDADREGPVDE